MHPLDEWRKGEAFKLTEAADFLGVPHGTFRDWIYFRRFPRQANIKKIEGKTGGRVTASDMHKAWMEHHHPEATEAAE